MLDQGQKTTSSPPPRGPERLGRYELVARVGEDAIAEVHLAREVGAASARKAVAIKKIHSHLSRDNEFIGVLLDDARASALIKHPRVVDIYDLGVSHGSYFIAMEYLVGQPLAAVLARAGSEESGLDVYSAARIIADAADGLHAGHTLRSVSGRPLELVHRDVGPASIVLLYDGTAKVIDFGMARARAHIAGPAGARAGSTGYAAPEQMTGGVVDRRADVFSLGVILWEMLARRPLFGTSERVDRLNRIIKQELQAPSVHRPEVPYELDQICMRALAVDPGERFQSAGNMQTAIEAFLRDASFRREDGALFTFLDERFAAERDEQRALVKRAGDPGAPVELARGSERRKPLLAGKEEGESGVQTFVQGADDDQAAAMARGSQHIPMPSPSEPRRLVPMPPPDARSRRRAAATSVPVREGRPSASGTGALRGARASSPTPKPRGKGRTGRIDSIADAWSDRAASPSSRTLPLPPPSDAAELAPDEPVTAAAEAVEEEEADDFTVVEPTKAPRSFESMPAPVTAAPTVNAVVGEEAVEPILTGNRSRGIWMAASVAVAAVLLIGALLFATLGGGTGGAAHEDEPLVAEPAASMAPAVVAPPVESAPEPAAEPAADIPPADLVRRDEPRRARRKVARRTADPAELYREGARLYVDDKLDAARRKFQGAVNVSPRFAPAHRGLGLVYERAGQKARAIRAFQTYLRLAPDAADAANIRARLERLRM